MISLQPGQKIERFQVVRRLGDGGMATVWLVQHERLGSLHALKVLTQTSPGLKERLLQEGRVQSVLKHPNVVPVTDVLDLGDSPALLMEYVPGSSLDRQLAQHRLDLDEADELARGILRGVAAVHRAGLVHRDLKPANVLVTWADGRPTPRIADFGLAKLLGEVGAGKTRSGVAMGTPSYMAPEQVRDAARVDARADVFALGAILFELVNGARAFTGEDSFEITTRVVAGEYPPLPDAVPVRMREAIDAALEIDPTKRPGDADALLLLWSRGSPSPPPVAWPPELIPPDDVSASIGSFDLPMSLGAPGSASPATFGATFEGSPSVVASLLPDTPSPTETAPARRGTRWWPLLLALAVPIAGVGAWSLRSRPPDRAAFVMLLGERPLLAGDARPGRPGWDLLTEGGLVVESRRTNAAGGPDVGMDPEDGGTLRRTYAYADGRLAEVVGWSGTSVAWRTRVDGDGERIRLDHLDAHGAPRRFDEPAGPWPDGFVSAVFAEEHTLDERGRSVQIRWLGPDGAPMAAADGSFGMGLAWDDQDRVVAREFTDETGAPGQSRSGATRVRYRYDDARFPDLVTRVAHEGLGDLPTFGAERWSARTLAYDAQGRLAATSDLDRDGRPQPDGDGCPGITWVYGDGERTRTCRDADGEPTPSASGWVAERRHDDERGLPTLVERLDAEGAPARGTWASLRRVWDDEGQLVELGPSLDADGEPMLLDRWDAYIVRFRHNAAREWTEVATLDAEGKSMLGRGYVAFTRQGHDAQGRLADSRVYGIDGQPILSPEGWHRSTHRNDERGREVERAFFDTTGQPVADADGVHRTTYAHDALGNITRSERFDAEGKPTPSRRLGFFAAQRAYDARGNLLESAVYGVDGEPVLNENGVFRVVMRYDQRDLLVEELDYGTDGELLDGHAITRWTYDALGQYVGAELRGPDKELLPEGCTRFVFGHDAFGNDDDTACFDAAGKPAPLPGLGEIARQRFEMDWRGRHLRATYFDVAGNPVAGPDLGCPEVRQVFREPHAEHVAQACFDGGGRPQLNRKGFHRLEIDRDGAGAWLELRYYAVDGEPTDDARTGYARAACQRDARGYVTEEAYFLASGAPATPARVHYAYDDARRAREMRYVDADGAPVLGPDGWANRRTGYDARGDATHTYYDAAGQEIAL